MRLIVLGRSEGRRACSLWACIKYALLGGLVDILLAEFVGIQIEVCVYASMYASQKFCTWRTDPKSNACSAWCVPTRGRRSCIL